MTYIIAEPCIDIKDRSCVDVCPVDCIHEFDRILVIDPEECIDCFAPGEEFFTPWGLRTFAELENSWTKVLTDDGFKPALVKRFRRKPLVEIEFAPAFEERDRYTLIQVASGIVLVALGLLLFFHREWWLQLAVNRALIDHGLAKP